MGEIFLNCLFFFYEKIVHSLVPEVLESIYKSCTVHSLVPEVLESIYKSCTVHSLVPEVLESIYKSCTFIQSANVTAKRVKLIQCGTDGTVEYRLHSGVQTAQWSTDCTVEYRLWPGVGTVE